MLKSVALGLMLTSFLAADIVTVKFDFDVYALYLYAQQEYDPAFTPEDITVTATFDDTPLATTVGDPSLTYTIFEGAPVITSPLTSTLPYYPGSDPNQNFGSQVRMNYYDYGPGQTGTYLWLYDSVYDGPWNYNLSIIPPTEGPVADPYSFSSADLVAWLDNLQASNAMIDFDEDSYEELVAGNYLGGLGYAGQGHIVSISVVSTPEPDTLPVLIVIGGLMGSILRKRLRAGIFF